MSAARIDLYTVESLPAADRAWLIADGFDLTDVVGITVTDDGTERHFHLEVSKCEECS